MRALVVTFNQEKALVHGPSPSYVILKSLQTFISSSSRGEVGGGAGDGEIGG